MENNVDSITTALTKWGAYIAGAVASIKLADAQEVMGFVCTCVVTAGATVSLIQSLRKAKKAKKELNDEVETLS